MRFQQIFVQHKCPNDATLHDVHHGPHEKLVEGCETVWPRKDKVGERESEYCAFIWICNISFNMGEKQ